MIYLEKLDRAKTYFTMGNAVMTPEKRKQEYPASEVINYVVETDATGKIMLGFYAWDVMMNNYGIDTDLSETDALQALKTAMENKQKMEIGPSTDERIAAALEYQVMASLPDVETETV